MLAVAEIIVREIFAELNKTNKLRWIFFAIQPFQEKIAEYFFVIGF